MRATRGEPADRHPRDVHVGRPYAGCPRCRGQADLADAWASTTWPVNPEPITPAPVNAAPVAGVDDTSPLVYILPGLVLSLVLAAGMGYAMRMSGRARRARVSA